MGTGVLIRKKKVFGLKIVLVVPSHAKFIYFSECGNLNLDTVIY